MDSDKRAHYYADMLRQLADGVNPITGEEIQEGLLDQPQIIRALYAGVQALSVQQNTQRLSSSRAIRHENAGKPWSDEDNTYLVDNHNAGMTNRDLAKALGRSELAVELRLEKLLNIPADEKKKAALLGSRV